MQESNFFLTVRGLSELLSSGEISSVELTEAYLDGADELDVPPFELPSEPRSDHDGKLSTMVTIARDQALESAERADREQISRSRPRSDVSVIAIDVRRQIGTSVYSPGSIRSTAA